MPCESGPSDPRDDEIRRLRRMLCATARKVRGEKLDDDQQVALASAEVWLVKHDAADRKRKKQEQEMRDMDKTRSEALKKLTPSERKALGLR